MAFPQKTYINYQLLINYECKKVSYSTAKAILKKLSAKHHRLLNEEYVKESKRKTLKEKGLKGYKSFRTGCAELSAHTG